MEHDRKVSHRPGETRVTCGPCGLDEVFPSWRKASVAMREHRNPTPRINDAVSA